MSGEKKKKTKLAKLFKASQHGAQLFRTFHLPHLRKKEYCIHRMSQNEHNLTSNSTGIATSLFNIIRTSHEGLDDSDRPLLSDYLILHLSISDRLLKGRISNY